MVQAVAANARCTRCVLSSGFPGAALDADGLCAFCRLQLPAAEQADRRERAWRQIRDLLTVQSSGPGPYDVIVAYSGGKDSSYLLWLLARKLGARCLAVTIDNGFVSPTAVENARRVVDALGVDHMVFRPHFAFMKTVYRESLKGDVHVPAARARASDVCNSCIKLINVLMVKTAMRYGCRIVAGGYIGAQVPKDGAVLELRLRSLASMSEFTLKTFVERFGPAARQFYSYDDVVPLAGEDDRLSIINPLLAVEYAETEVFRRIGELGWQRPADTGTHSSNCQINDLGIVNHLGRYGFHPYEAELSEQVRGGTMLRADALARVETVPDAGKIRFVLRRLDVEESEHQ